jgi:hypothetical protein
MKYICIHYGFGDYVICYGMIRELAKKHDKVMLFAIPHRSFLHIDNICRLYDSIPNVFILTDDPLNYEDVLYIGWDKFAEHIKTDSQTPFPKFFYDQVGISINLMWDNFYFKRDLDKEKEIYYKLGLKDGEEYIFLHDDPVRGFVINKKYIPDMRIIHLVEHEDISILDILYVVEKAKEVHTFTTGLVPFIDQMNIWHSSLNLHRYIRPLPYDQPILRLNWNIIK